MNMWDTEPSPLHCRRFEINEEREQFQEVEWTVQRMGSLLGTLTDHDHSSILLSQGPRM